MESHPFLFSISPSSPSSASSVMNLTSQNVQYHNSEKAPSSLIGVEEDESTSNGNGNVFGSKRFVGSDIDAASKEEGERDTKKMKKAKYAFQTRSHVDVLDDGYRWRKYGQKAVKNNKFPRSYYRCTHQGCNVKKQIQRLTKDEGIVMTTYEGMHSHPIQKSTENFENILGQMQIYASF